MNSKNRTKSRRRTTKTSPRSRNSSNSFEFSALFRLCQIFLAALLLYVTAALFTRGAGELGEDLASYVLRCAGGGIVLILLHFFYGLFCSLLGRLVSRVCSQWLGTVCLYGAVCLFLGMLQKSGLARNIGLLSPGLLGQFLSGFLPRVIGAIGTMLVGLCLVFLSAFNYGHLSSSRVAWVREKCSGLHLPTLPRWHRKKGEEPDIDESVFSAPPAPVEETESFSAEEQEEKSPEPSVEEFDVSEPSQEELLPEEDEEETDGREKIAKAGLFASIAAAFSSLFGRDHDAAGEEEHELQPSDEREEYSEEEEHGWYEDEQEQETPDSRTESEQFVQEPDEEDEWKNEDEPDDEQEPKESDELPSQLPAEEPVRPVRPVRPDLRPEPAVPLTKKPSVEIEPSGALAGTEEEVLPGGRQIAPGSFPPPLDLLGPHKDIREAVDDVQAQENGRAVIESLANFGVSAELKRTIIGPTVVQYQIQLAPGIKVSKVSALGNDIAVALGVPSIRVEAPIPGTSYIGIELPNVNRRAVPLRQILESEVFQRTKLNLPLPLGQTVDGRILISGLEELPHLLIAGTTGSGKSIFVNNCIVAMCYHNTPEQLRFIMVDPKRVEMGIYESLPHILAKPIVTPTAAVHALAWAVREMERRYDACSLAKVRSLASYNEKVLPKDRMPHIVIIVDELADLMMTAQKEVEEYIMRLAQMARAVGIHLMLATQRPSVNVLTGTIKANIPARVSFSLPSVADSRTIIDVSGAQNLLGKGDMLFVSTRSPHPMRIQSPFMDEQTNIRVVEYLRSTFGDPEYVDLDEQGDESGGGKSSEFLEDSRLEEAIKIVLGTGVASSSGLQRQMRIGFTRAARMIDTMEAMGIVGPQNGAKPREILVDEAEALEILDQQRG